MRTAAAQYRQLKTPIPLIIPGWENVYKPIGKKDPANAITIEETLSLKAAYMPVNARIIINSAIVTKCTKHTFVCMEASP